MKDLHCPATAVALVFFALIATPLGLSAQRRISGPQPASVRVIPATAVVGSTRVRSSHRQSGLLGDGSQDHRYTGFLVGALVVAVPGVIWFAACSQANDFCDRGKLAWRVPLGTAVSGLIGALVGAAIPK